MPSPRLRWVLLLVAVLAVAGALRASRSRIVGSDYLRYHRAGRLVATGQSDRIYDPAGLSEQFVYAAERDAERAAAGLGPAPRPIPADALLARPPGFGPYFEEEFKYLPATAVLMAPVGALHPRTGWIVWGAWNGALIGVTIAAAWAFAARGTHWRWMLVPLVVLARAAGDNHNLGQLNPSAIAPATVAVWAIDRGRDRLAGGLAALGAVVKFLPLALAVWFALKRRWLAAGVTVAGFVALAWGLPAAVLGPARATELTSEYLARRASVYTEAAPPDLPGQSVKSFVYRVFGGVKYQTGSGAKRIEWDLSVAAADPDVLRVAVWAILAAMLGAVVGLTHGPLRAGDDPRGPPEAGLFVCWMLLASPEARAPHFLYLVIPAAALTCALVRAWRDRAPWRKPATALAIGAAVFVNGDSSSLFGRDLSGGLSAFCALGWATLAIAVALVLALRGAPTAGASPHEP